MPDAGMWLPAALTLPALFAAGVAASPHCGLMCGPLQALQLRARGTLPMSSALLALHGGRLLGYALLGAAAGSFGTQLLLLLQNSGFGHLARLLPAAAMVTLGLACLRHPRQQCQHKALPAISGVPVSVRMLLLGLIWALLPCALLYGLLFLASASGGPLAGALLLTAFGLGTLPMLTAAGGTLDRMRGLGATRLRIMSASIFVAVGVASVAHILFQGIAPSPWCMG